MSVLLDNEYDGDDDKADAPEPLPSVPEPCREMTVTLERSLRDAKSS